MANTYDWKAGYDAGFEAGAALVQGQLDEALSQVEDLEATKAHSRDLIQLLVDCHTWIRKHQPKRGDALLTQIEGAVPHGNHLRGDRA